MPDGFDPVIEMERIYTARDMMLGCRERLPVIFEILDKCLAMVDQEPQLAMQAATIYLDRGFGKPRQATDLNINVQQNQRRVMELPSNGRDFDSLDGPPTIDAQVE